MGHEALFALDLRHASIDEEINAGNVRTFIGGEEQGGGCDFLGLASSAEWNFRNPLRIRVCEAILWVISGNNHATVGHQLHAVHVNRVV